MFASSEDYLNESENFGNNNQYKYRLLFRYFLKNKNCGEKKNHFFPILQSHVLVSIILKTSLKGGICKLLDEQIFKLCR